jgi:hypothetical protein
MKRLMITTLIALCGCDDGEGRADSGVDSGLDAGGLMPAALATSLATWNALAAANPGPYWYETENCVINSISGSSTVVQVEGFSARAVGQRSYRRSDCKAQVNRLGTLIAPMPELHSRCANLLARRGDTRLAFDSQGVVSHCYVSDAPDCKDACGDGFYLLARGFGIATVPDTGTPDAGD